jgi:ATP-dependent Clp protease ATP-binding subunit ClpC
MFERFTDQARRVVVLAQEESRILNHNYIGTEHLLLGMLHEGEGGAATALQAMGIGLEAVRQQVEETVGRGKENPSGHIPFTPRAKKVLELSLRESLQLGHDYIGSEHILLGLIREGDGLAAQILVRLGADLAGVREQVLRQLADQPAGQRAERSTGRAGGSAGVLEGIVSRLDAIAERLTAIERRLGIGEPPAEPPAEPTAEPPAA